LINEDDREELECDAQNGYGPVGGRVFMNATVGVLKRLENEGYVIDSDVPC
jgi:hypothetical protein